MILWFRWSLTGPADLSGLAHTFSINCYVGWQLNDLGSLVGCLIGCWLRHVPIFSSSHLPAGYNGLVHMMVSRFKCKRACPNAQVVFKQLFCIILLMFVHLAKTNHIANPNSKVGKLSPPLDGKICTVTQQNAGRRRISGYFYNVT